MQENKPGGNHSTLCSYQVPWSLHADPTLFVFLPTIGLIYKFPLGSVADLPSPYLDRIVVHDASAEP